MNDRITLLRIAASMLHTASMLHNPNFPSVFSEDHPRRTPRRIIMAAEAAQDQLQRWAVELAAIARRMEDKKPQAA